MRRLFFIQDGRFFRKHRSQLELRFRVWELPVPPEFPTLACWRRRRLHLDDAARHVGPATCDTCGTCGACGISQTCRARGTCKACGTCVACETCKTCGTCATCGTCETSGTCGTCDFCWLALPCAARQTRARLSCGHSCGPHSSFYSCLSLPTEPPQPNPKAPIRPPFPVGGRPGTSKNTMDPAPSQPEIRDFGLGWGGLLGSQPTDRDCVRLGSRDGFGARAAWQC